MTPPPDRSGRGAAGSPMANRSGGGVKAVILAAGYATRLYPLTLDTPKCLLSVGGRTILDSICRKLNDVTEVDQIVLVTNEKFHRQLENWKKTAFLRTPLRVLNDGTTSNETRLGAIGDLSFAIHALGLGADILMMASDNLFDAGLEDFLRFARSKKGAVSTGLHDIGDPKLAAGKYGVLEMGAQNEVTRIEEKPASPKASTIGMGFYYFPKETLGRVAEYLSSKEAKDAPGHYLRWILGRVKIFGFVFSGMWYDIGDLNALEEANKIFSERKS